MSSLGNRTWVVTKSKVKKLYELLTALGLAALASSEAETPVCGVLVISFILRPRQKDYRLDYSISAQSWL